MPYAQVEHVPLLGEPLLRWRARRSGQRVASVPLLVDESGAYGDSWEIMKRAEAIGSGAPLFFDPEACERVHEMVEPALRAGRARVVLSTLENRDALTANARAVAPAALAPLLRPVAAMGAKFLARKHEAEAGSIEAHDESIAVVLDGLRSELRGRPYLLGRFSAADITVAGLLQLVEPVADRWISLDPAIRACWRSPRLAARFAELATWRDDLYAEHRLA